VLNAGQGAAAWLAGGTFYVNQTITFKMSQQSILGQGRRVTTIVAVDGFTADRHHDYQRRSDSLDHGGDLHRERQPVPDR